MSELTAEAALKLVGEIFVYHMPFNRALGLELERYEKAFAQLSFNNQPMMVGNWAQSILHGGVIAGFMEHAAMLHLLMFMGIPHLPKIIDFSIDYLRAGHYRDTYVQCQVWRQGRRVANVAMTAWQTSQSEPIATARAHFKVDEP